MQASSESGFPAPLWDYACALYARPGVQALCLDWQLRHAADIPLVLALCWQAARARTLPDAGGLDRLCRALAPWRASTVLRLRTLRKRLKPLSPPASRSARLRAAVARAELCAERVQLEYLALALPARRGTGDPASAMRRGVETYLELLGVSARERARETDRLADVMIRNSGFRIQGGGGSPGP
ncbi:TIGR02444 family protein [Thioalkalivibrio thiocyanodenitrificans]|uniref:TIGR02444 family protein n=1 Tax=Thioalkalivibrio thiocyanodenitrificans TaxID=243063 RepID=UPI0003739C25|nr:TIGR02444 family protein [Thioalkalivibrio thiocyanodenitrificans]